MSRPEDFDIVDDDETLPRRMPSWWLWLGGAALLIVLAGGFALATFSQRVSSPGTATDPVAVGPTPTPVETLLAPAPAGDPTATPTVEPAPEASPTPTATPEDTPTPEPSPSPTPCPHEPAGEFAPRYDYQELGCPTGPPQTVWSAWQPFQGGQMFWRRDTDQAFVLANSGLYSPVRDSWDGSPPPDRGQPPQGLHTPERGFGAVWARNDDIFNLLGWATATERGFCARIQDYEYGAMVISDPTPSCTPENLFNHATAADWPPIFFRFTEAGTWR